MLLNIPKRLKCCRPVGTVLWLDSEQHYAASPLSLYSLSQETCHPHAPISFAYSTLLQNVFCAQIRMCACTHAHPPVTGTLLASSAIIIQSCPCSIRQERNKSKDRDCVWSEEGSYKDTRSHLQSQPHQSMQKLNSLSFVLWFTEDDKSGGLWLKICGKEGSQEKRPFLFLRGGIDSSVYFNYLQCFVSF